MVHRSLIVVVPLCLALGCCSPSPSSPTPPAPTATAPTFATLSGTVADDATSAALANASVTIVDGPNSAWTTTTDGSGAYRLAGLTLAGFNVRFASSGYDTVTRGVNLTGDTTVAIRLVRTKLNLSGAYTVGSYSQNLNGGITTDPVITATMMQSGTSVTGTFVAERGRSGTFTVTLSSEFPDATISGTMRITTPRLLPPNTTCSGSGPVTGTASPFVLIGPSFVPECITVLRDVKLTLSR